MTDQQRPSNCPWGFRCQRTWDDLVPADDVSARFCKDCEKDVHWVDTLSEFFDGKKRGDCMCFYSELLSRSYPEFAEYQNRDLNRGPHCLIGAVVFHEDHKPDYSRFEKVDPRNIIERIKTRMKRS